MHGSLPDLHSFLICYSDSPMTYSDASFIVSITGLSAFVIVMFFICIFPFIIHCCSDFKLLHNSIPFRYSAGDFLFWGVIFFANKTGARVRPLVCKAAARKVRVGATVLCQSLERPQSPGQKIVSKSTHLFYNEEKKLLTAHRSECEHFSEALIQIHLVLPRENKLFSLLLLRTVLFVRHDIDRFGLSSSGSPCDTCDGNGTCDTWLLPIGSESQVTLELSFCISVFSSVIVSLVTSLHKRMPLGISTIEYSFFFSIG